MECIKSARIPRSFRHGVPLILLGTVVVSVASANPLTRSQVFPDDVSYRKIEIAQATSRAMPGAVPVQGKGRKALHGITLQNIHSIGDLDIFRSELMTKSELAKFREDLKQIETQGQLQPQLTIHFTQLAEWFSTVCKYSFRLV